MKVWHALVLIGLALWLIPSKMWRRGLIFSFILILFFIAPR